MNSNKLHICCSIDDNYARHCGAMLCSLFENNKGAIFEIHILISKLSEQNISNFKALVKKYESICHFYVVDTTKIKGVKFRENRPLTEAAYYRILVSSILDKSIKKILYLDADLLVLRDIIPLFSLDISNYALAAPKDLAELSDERRFQLSMSYSDEYFCSGMMLVNLEYWRQHDSEKHLITFSKKDRVVYNHDQDALNAVFHNQWFMLSPKWNRFFPFNYKKSFFDNMNDYYDFLHEPIVVHFVNYFKPWNRFFWVGRKWNKYRKLYHRYLSMTQWGDLSPQDINVKKYAKLGLYKYLLTYSFQSILRGFADLLFTSMPLFLEKILSFPFLLVLKVYYRFIKS